MTQHTELSAYSAICGIQRKAIYLLYFFCIILTKHYRHVVRTFLTFSLLSANQQYIYLPLKLGLLLEIIT